jgi:uncharacterized membrane protein
MVVVVVSGLSMLIFSVPPKADMRLVLIYSICAALIAIVLFLGWRSAARWNEWDEKWARWSSW